MLNRLKAKKIEGKAGVGVIIKRRRNRPTLKNNPKWPVFIAHYLSQAGSGKIDRACQLTGIHPATYYRYWKHNPAFNKLLSSKITELENEIDIKTLPILSHLIEKGDLKAIELLYKRIGKFGDGARASASITISKVDIETRLKSAISKINRDSGIKNRDSDIKNVTPKKINRDS